MMIQSLQSDQSFSVSCNDNSWRVYTCNSTRVFCVNCKEKCIKNVICPDNSYVINPCVYCKTDVIASSIVSFQYAYYMYNPQYLKPLSVQSINNTAVLVTTVLDRFGKLVCSGFPATHTITSLYEIYKSGESAVSNVNGNTIELVLANLMPSTKYIIYCYTDDNSNHLMGLPQVLQNKIIFHTDCCKGIKQKY